MKNIFQCNFSGNIFNAGSDKTYLLYVNNNVHPYDNFACAEPENPPPNDFGLNITNNSFTGGVIQIYLNCLASSFTPFYITKNYFNGALVLPRIGILTNKSSGIIKNNTFTSDYYDYSFKFYQSDFSLFGNTTSSEYLNIELNTSSGANLGPVSSSGSRGEMIHTYCISKRNVLSL